MVYFSQVVAYAEKTSEVAVRWNGFEDLDSGIEHFIVTLWTKGLCSSTTSDSDYTLMQTVELSGEHFNYTFTNLSLAVRTVRHCSKCQKNC